MNARMGSIKMPPEVQNVQNASRVPRANIEYFAGRIMSVSVASALMASTNHLLASGIRPARTAIEVDGRISLGRLRASTAVVDTFNPTPAHRLLVMRVQRAGINRTALQRHVLFVGWVDRLI